MPNESGRLTEGERQRVADWLTGKTAHKNGLACPACGGKSFSVLPHVVQLMPFTGGGLVVGGAVYPLVGVCCENCSNVQTFMAIHVGIVNNG